MPLGAAQHRHVVDLVAVNNMNHQVGGDLLVLVGDLAEHSLCVVCDHELVRIVVRVVGLSNKYPPTALFRTYLYNYLTFKFGKYVSAPLQV